MRSALDETHARTKTEVIEMGLRALARRSKRNGPRLTRHEDDDCACIAGASVRHSLAERAHNNHEPTAIERSSGRVRETRARFTRTFGTLRSRAGARGWCQRSGGARLVPRLVPEVWGARASVGVPARISEEATRRRCWPRSIACPDHCVSSPKSPSLRLPPAPCKADYCSSPHPNSPTSSWA
jgi:hypothetical protein